MRLHFIFWTIAVALLASACGGDDTTVSADGPGAESRAASPELAVSGIIRGIGQDDSSLLDAMTLTEQLGVVALVEGASTTEALAALGFASEQIASTFWMSFSSGIGDFVDSGVNDILIGEVTTLDVAGARYATVDVRFPLDSGKRVFVVTERDGWRVDLIATFPGAFVSSIPFAVERASSPGVDPLLLDSIRDQEVSLEVLEALGTDDRTAGAISEARAAMGVGAETGP